MDEACRLLGVRPQTVYAYVSRGKLEVMPDPADTRRSLYRAEDVAGLAKRKQAGRKHETLAANTLFGSEPSIPTALCAFFRGRPYYRGQDAVSLARHGHPGRCGPTVVGRRATPSTSPARQRRCARASPGGSLPSRPWPALAAAGHSTARTSDPGAARRGPEPGRSTGQCVRRPAGARSRCICALRRVEAIGPGG